MRQGGILSPWAERPEAQVDPLEDARAGRQPVRFNGRVYSIVVTLPFRFEDEGKALGLATQTLGECLEELRPVVEPLLQAQKITIGQKPLVPSVEFDLGVLTLYAVASSTDERLARAMAIDRLAHVLSVLVVSDPRAKALMANYRTTILRTA